MGQKSLCKSSYDKLSNEELISLYQKGNDEIKEYFFEKNKALIYGILKRFNKGKRDEDLYQIACMGFIKAFNNFDFKFEVKFTTYAVPIILGEIKKSFRDEGSIHVARSIKENYIKIQSAKVTLQQALYEEPSLSQLAKETNLQIEDIIVAMEANQFVGSMDAICYENDNSVITLHDISKDESTTDITLISAIAMESEKLSIEEQKFIKMRFFENMKQVEIASILNVSQVQISRLEKKVLLKLREKFIL